MKQKSFKQDDFSKGLNLFTRDTMIKEKESYDASNIWGVGKNSLKKRPGTRLICEVAGASKICGLGTYYSSTVRELLIMAGDKFYKESGGSASRIGAQTWTANLRTDLCQAGGKVFIQNGTEVLREYNGTTTSDTSNGQTGKFCIFYKGSLWTAGDTSYPTRLYRSGSGAKLGDFTYHDPDNLLATSVYVGKDDGQKITGLFKHQDYLYVAKENSIWRVSQATDAAGTITLALVDPARGAAAHHTIDSVDNDVFFFNDKGVYAFGYEPNMSEQIRTNIVSLRIDPNIKSIQKDRLEEAPAIYFDNHYYLAYTSGGGGSNDKIAVYDRQRLGWWKFNLGANCLTEYKDSSGYSYLYYGSATDGKVLYFDDTAKSDNAAAISTKWKTGKWSFKDYVQQKFFHFITLYFGRIRGKITVNVYIDGDLHKTESVVLGSGATGGIGTRRIGKSEIGIAAGSTSDTAEITKIALNKMGKNIQVEITDSENERSWELSAIEGIFTPINKNYVKT